MSNKEDRIDVIMGETTIHHIAVMCTDRVKAEIFFTKILGVPLAKNFLLSAEMTNAIFGVSEKVEVDVFDDGCTRFEVFYEKSKRKSLFEHICIEVKRKNDFIVRCKEYGLEPFEVQKDGKTLLFVRDFSGNLYEVKECMS